MVRVSERRHPERLARRCYLAVRRWSLPRRATPHRRDVIGASAKPLWNPALSWAVVVFDHPDLSTCKEWSFVQVWPAQSDERKTSDSRDGHPGTNRTQSGDQNRTMSVLSNRCPFSYIMCIIDQTEFDQSRPMCTIGHGIPYAPTKTASPDFWERLCLRWDVVHHVGVFTAGQRLSLPDMQKGRCSHPERARAERPFPAIGASLA